MLPEAFRHSNSVTSITATHDELEDNAWAADMGPYQTFTTYDLGSLPVELYGDQTTHHRDHNLSQTFPYSLGHDRGYEHPFQQDALCPQGSTLMHSQTSTHDLATVLKQEDWDTQRF
jgi:hypothetical protein